MLERRRCVALVGAAALGWISPVGAAPARVPLVGMLMGLAADDEAQRRSKTFEEALQRAGWIRGENLRIEYRYANGDEQVLKGLAAELVALKCDCIVAQSTPVVAALKQLTRTIPIVFVAVTDPIGSRFVASLSRPGGNITGFTIVQSTISGKYLSMLHELSPQLSHATIIYNPESAPFGRSFFVPAFAEAANQLGILWAVAEVRSSDEIERAIMRLGATNGGALVVVPDNFLSLNRRLLIDLAAKYRIPAVYPYRYFAMEGGLVSYGMDAVESFERAANYVSRILQGAKPADLPVQEPTKFELVINLKTARALGVAVPRILMAAADEIID